MLSNQEAYEYMKSEYDAAVDRAKHIGHKGKTKYMKSLETAMSVLLKNGIDGITVTQENFGTLAICAIRYCQGRETYMPSLVQGILKPHLHELSDKDLNVMIDDCEFQETMNLYGSDTIDKPDWLAWKEALLAEKESRVAKRIKEDMDRETLLYQMLKKHVGHRVEIAEYGDGINFSLEDMDTNEIIFDTDIYDLTGRSRKEE